VKPIERVARSVDAFQQRHTVTAVLYGVVKKYGDDNAGILVANLAYSAFVAIFPLLLVLITILALVLASDPSARARLVGSTFSQFPLVGSALSRNIHTLKRSSAIGLVVGLLGLLWGSIGLAQSGQFTMAEIWNLEGPDRPSYRDRLLRGAGFLGVMATGMIVTTFLAGFGTFGRHDVVLGLVGEGLAALVNVGQYLLAFRTLTPKMVDTPSLVPGAIVGGVAWTLLQALGGYLIGHDLRHDSALYGTFGIVLGLVAWLYLGARIAIYAAELNTVLAQHLWPRGLVQPPSTEADQRSMAAQATKNRRRPEQRVHVGFVERAMTQRQWLHEQSDPQKPPPADPQPPRRTK
jgi:YihY family inner membrane protein